MGETFLVPLTIRNTGQGAQDFTILCTVDGVEQDELSYPNIPAGGQQIVEIPIVCEEPGTVEIDCLVMAVLSDREECMAQTRVSTQVVCREACVGIAMGKNGDAVYDICVGDRIAVPVTVENCATEPADLTVTCTGFGGEPVVRTFPNVPAGGFETFEVDVTCEEPGEFDIVCTVEGALVADDACTAEAESSVRVICREACVTLTALEPELETCVDAEIEVPFRVTNCGTEPANLVVRCTVGGGNPMEFAIDNVPAGEDRMVNVPVLCAEVGEVAVNCEVTASLVSNPECTDEAAASATVNCVQACVELVSEDVEVCVGETAIVLMEISNCSQGVQNATLECMIDGVTREPIQVNGIEPGETEIVPVEVLCREGEIVEVWCNVRAYLADNPDCTAEAESDVKVTCLEPSVDIVKSTNPETTDDLSMVTITVRNTGTSTLDPVRVSDHIPEGLFFDPNQPIFATCGDVDVAEVQMMNGATWVYFTEIALDPGESCTITYDLQCEGAGEAIVDTAKVVAWCEGVLETNPDFPGVTDSDTARVTCVGEACPRTIGFWRQQCAQKNNGSTKICRGGMEYLFRQVIELTGVVEWKRNDGSYESTASLAALDDAALFEALCSQLQGPRPMTHRDMAELQYIALLLNVTSEALPSGTPLVNSGGFTGTVAEAIEAIEAAINGGGDVNYWKGVADAINNRQGVQADSCPDENGIFAGLPCNGDDSRDGLGNRGPASLSAYPNPAINASTTIQYSVPEEYAERGVRVEVFDVSGRLVRILVNEPTGAGVHTVTWDLRNHAGAQVPAGVYFYCLSTGGEMRTQRGLVLRQ